MSAAARETRNTIKEALLSRAYFTEELAAEIGISVGTCQSMINDLRKSGEPVQMWDSGRWMIAYPKDRRCTECNAFLNSHNPTNKCLCHTRVE